MTEQSTFEISISLRDFSSDLVVRKMWKEDFQCSECKLNYNKPEVFTRSFWQEVERVSPVWILYRALVAVYFITTWIISFLHVGRDVPYEDAVKYLIFLTNWTYTLQTWQYVLALIIVIFQAVKEKDNGEVKAEKMPCHFKLYWALNNIIVSASMCVTIIFWAAVYDPELNPLDFINMTTHVFNSIFMIIDFILVGHPFRITHIYWPIIYAVLYLAFSLLYQLNGGTATDGRIPIYAILDWTKPGYSILTCVFAQMLLMAIHILFWLFYKAKVAVKKKRSSSSGGKTQKQGIENLGMDMRIV